MGRPPAYELSAVVAAAGELFWERGYQMTSISDLEERTGLDRSSLYHAFGSKQALFETALRCYVEENIRDRLAGMRQAGAGLAAVVSFFAGMARAFRADRARASRGCLMVNTVAELGAHDAHSVLAAAAYRDRLREAFGTALSRAAARGEVGTGRVQARANLLASTTMGLFLTARIDPADAGAVCDSVAAEIRSWRRNKLDP